jgi:photosystem II stability/assembly factor-like uncharacterized protein
MDKGVSWKNIVKDSFKYNSFNTQKNLYIDHKDSLIEFLNQYGIVYPRYYQGSNLVFDTLTQTSNAIIGDGNLKYDLNYNYFYVNSNELHKYTTRWFDSDVIFNKGDRISNYFVYSDSVNYVITDKTNGTYNIYKLNSIDGQSRLLVQGYQPGAQDKIIITEKGNILIPTFQGLMLSRNEGKSNDLITFDSIVDPKVRIYDLRLTLNGDILMQAGKDYYYSGDDGENWSKLGAFNKEFPQYLQIKKLVALDSQLAVLIINDKCDLEKAYLLSPLNNKWNSIDAGISVSDLENVFKNRTERFFANNQQCEIIYSDDESKTWNTYFIQGKNLISITRTKSKVLFAVTKEKKELYKSFDNGNSWTLISDIDLGVPTVEITGVKPLFDQTLILSGGIKDIGSVNYKETFLFLTEDNGLSWKVLPKVNNQYIYNLAWDGNSKIISYFTSLKVVYSSADLGQSWVIDHTFDGFDNINSIYFIQNGGVVIYGRYNGEYNIFVSYDRKNFVNCVGNYFKKDYVVLNEVKYPYIAAIAGLNGVYLSNDGGLNWENITSGITILDSIITPINSIYIDENNQAYLSIRNDGLYKSINPLVTIENKINSKSFLLVYPNPFQTDLFLKCQWCSLNNNIFEIYDPIGKLIRKEILDKQYTQLHFNQVLASGLYTYKMTRSGLLYSSGKILKLNE